MKHTIPILLPALSVALLAAVSARAEYILWFSVLDDAELNNGDGTSAGTVASYTSEDNEKVNAARIRVTGDGVADDTFLPIYYEGDTAGSWVLNNTVNYTGVNPGSDSTQWQPASLGDYASPDYTFALEIGAYDVNSGEFTQLGVATADYTTLFSGGNISQGGVSMQSQMPWAPSSFSIPEPSTGLLALAGVLALFRKRHPRHATRATKTLVPALAVLLSAVAVRAGSPGDELVFFSTIGPDTYADGTTVLDGESYALVWSADGEFDGLYADGSPVNPEERVLIVVPGAKDGCLQNVVFEVPAALADELRGGAYAIYLLDTRVQNADGTVAPWPAVDNVPALVNGYGVIVDGMAVQGTRSTGKFAAQSSGLVESATASTAAAAPKGVEQPKVKAIRIEGDRAVLTIENLPGFMRVQGGETLDSVGSTVGPAAKTDGGEDVEIVAPATGPDSGFFRVLRN